MAGGAVIFDGPLPIGDAIGVCLLAAAAAYDLFNQSKRVDEREGDGTRGKSIEEIKEAFKDKLSKGELQKLVEKVEKLRGKRNKQKRENQKRGKK